VAAAVTLPDPAGVAHVPSPLQNVLEDADVPEFRFATGKFPVTSAERLTAPKLGTPPALPCRTVVVVPRDPNVWLPWLPEPTMMAFAVKDAALVTQVVQPTVPVVVTVPPVSGALKVMLVTVPLPGGAAHVPSPRQKVEPEAAVPEFKLVTGKFPVTSVVSATAPKVGAPPALPCSTVVVVPRLATVLIACNPLPIRMRLAVSAEAEVVQVAQAMVPVVVIGPPVRGAVVPTELTEPEPPGIAHVPSPRQKVVAPAEVPELRLVTGRLPVTPVAKLISGISAATRDLNVGAAAAPVVGPAATVLADWLVIVKVRTGVDVGEVTAALK